MAVEDQEEFVRTLEDYVGAALRLKMDGLYVDVREDGSVQSPDDAVDAETARNLIDVVGRAVRLHAKAWEDVDLPLLFDGMAPLLRDPPEGFDEFWTQARKVRRNAMRAGT